MTKAVVLFSGGQDSTTCLYWAKSEYDEVHAVSIDYGQRHRAELDAAVEIARMAEVPHETLSFHALAQLGGNALTDRDQKIASAGGLQGLPSTFVPMRNVLFITLASARAVQWGASTVVCGACETDFSGYPDCRRDTMDATERALSLAVDGQVQIVTPLMRMSKADTVRLARSLHGCWDALAMSVTCYHGSRPGCGECPACALRERGFIEAGEQDPAGDRESIIINRIYTFEASHWLPKVPNGHKCGRVHGHSYRVIVSVRGPIREDGMVCDFADIDAVAKPIIARVDHQMLNDFVTNPTSELLARWFRSQFISIKGLHGVSVSETERSSCEVFRG